MVPSLVSRARRPSLWSRLRAPVSTFKRTIVKVAAASTAIIVSCALVAKNALPFQAPRSNGVTTSNAGAVTKRRLGFSAFSPFALRTGNLKTEAVPASSEKAVGPTSPVRGARSAHLEAPVNPSTPEKSELPPSTDAAADLEPKPMDAGAPTSEKAAGVAASENEPDSIPDKPEPYWKSQPVFKETTSFPLSGDCSLVLHLGDITKWAVNGITDAIVNAANERMLGGGGVDGAIHRAAGPELLEMCRAAPQGEPGIRCPTGSAVTTGSGNLPAKRVIHTVGPIYDAVEDPASLLVSAYRNSLEQARIHGVEYVAFPAISCGIYGYPFDEAADVSIRTLRESCDGIKEVHFILFGKKEMDAWLAASRSLLTQASGEL